MFIELEPTNDEQIPQESILVVGSLKDLHSEITGNESVVPMAGLPNFDAEEVRKRIECVDPEIADDFGFKKDAQMEAPFRLIRPEKIDEIVPAVQLPTFIALSYCWHNPSWDSKDDPASVIMVNAKVSWPISASMVKALLLERTSWDEGIWIDQCCINQDDPQEKSQTIAFMNRIYEQARVVAIVLEDIVIDDTERGLLEDLIQQCYNRGPTEPSVLLENNLTHRIVGLALKILSARWFTRAWCNHELLVSKNHIFFVGVQNLGHDQPKVLRITLKFLNSMILVCSRYDYTGAQDKHHSTLMARYRELRFLHVILNPFGLGGGYNLGHAEDDDLFECRLKSPVETLRNLRLFGATVAADKLAITLNIVGSGLYYKGAERSEHDCGLLISVVALTAGDPTVLCASGARYDLLKQSSRSSWMQRPERLDFVGIAGRVGTFRRLEYVPDFTLEEIVMDFHHVISGADVALRRASEPFLTQAQQYIDGCVEMSKVDPMFELGATLAENRAMKIQVLACALECGPQWINVSASAKTSEDYPDSDLKIAVEIFITNREDELSIHRLAERCRDQYEVLTDFIETLMLDYVSPMNVPGWTPAWVSIGPAEMDRLLFMCPADTQKFVVMIPTLLLNANYTNCKRIFLLESVCPQEDVWKVFGKSLGFGGNLEVLAKQNTRLKRKQIVRG
ncbi:MAG: hypothetical protein LQ350_004892 [Teloschistes chrysophthalmus]|nr:MAG: hypothetical protein LQ350_004892 [Niorma chrysophthalma]